MLDVLADSALGLTEKLGQLLLVQPQSFSLQYHIDASGAILALVDQELLGGRSWLYLVHGLDALLLIASKFGKVSAIRKSTIKRMTVFSAK